MPYWSPLLWETLGSWYKLRQPSGYFPTLGPTCKPRQIDIKISEVLNVYINCPLWASLILNPGRKALNHKWKSRRFLLGWWSCDYGSRIDKTLSSRWIIPAAARMLTFYSLMHTTNRYRIFCTQYYMNTTVKWGRSELLVITKVRDSWFYYKVPVYQVQPHWYMHYISCCIIHLNRLLIKLINTDHKPTFLLLSYLRFCGPFPARGLERGYKPTMTFDWKDQGISTPNEQEAIRLLSNLHYTEQGALRQLSQFESYYSITYNLLVHKCSHLLARDLSKIDLLPHPNISANRTPYRNLEAPNVARANYTAQTKKI